MKGVRGVDSLIRHVLADLRQGHDVQVSDGSEALGQLMIWARVRECQSEVGALRSSQLLVVVPTARDMAPYLNFARHCSTIAAASIPVHALPAFSLWGFERFINPALERRQRISAMAQLAGQGDSVLVTTIKGLAQFTLPRDSFEKAEVEICVGDEWDLEELFRRLEDLGFHKAMTVEEEGAYAVRGGIVDCWSMSMDLPVRLEFRGDLVVGIRAFSPVEQRSVYEVGSVRLVPCFEVLTPSVSRSLDSQTFYNGLLERQIAAADRDGMLKAFQLGVRFSGFEMFSPLMRRSQVTALEWLRTNDLVFFPNGIDAAVSAFIADLDKMKAGYAADRKAGRPAVEPLEHFAAWGSRQEFLQACKSSFRILEFGNPYSQAGKQAYRIEGRLTLEGAPLPGQASEEHFEKWVEFIRAVCEGREVTVVILAHQEEQLGRLASLLVHRGLGSKRISDLLSQLESNQLVAGTIYLGLGDLASHIWLDEHNVLIVPEQNLFGVRSRPKKAASAKLQNYLSSFTDLKVGDLVVHAQHGIGRYQGITALSLSGTNSDFLVVEYHGGDKVYVPVDRVSLLQRYSASAEGSSTHLVDKLGGAGFEKRKAAVKKVIKDMAEELLKIEAKRRMVQGYLIEGKDDTYTQFEAEFPYEETEDQARAIEDALADLASGRPMDRLICGDVGFGKTEVAMRAAMMAVLHGYQVLVLVPTTVLCYQHFRTFSERLETHGIRVARADRFVASRDIKSALLGLEQGRVDVLIGTHRILSKDIRPAKLGLLVVDEEQRFGVQHKERLKALKAKAHILTLSATPIPRTLHMAMIGLRDISIIATPPQDRMSVKTYIAQFDETLIKDAIQQEVARGGQVFFVHNRVEDIELQKAMLAALLPDLEIRVGHGQMAESALEKVIVDFIEKKFQVLVCTTIIESGIDMPNVNTLIVNRADRYGLAQLYQIRGRVGRANLQAYAYFLTPKHITDEARERLSVLVAYQDLGAGFQIASHDLELRGAGNLLGAEQSGQVAAVGLELYTEMLEQAINALRGVEVDEKIDCEIKLPVSVRIPKEYIAHESHRLQLYKELFSKAEADELATMREEMRDRFGEPPFEVDMLFRLARLKQVLKALRCVRLTGGATHCELRFSALSEKQVERLAKAVRAHPHIYHLTPDFRLLLAINAAASSDSNQQKLLIQTLIEHLEPLVNLV